jgi:hypothetical protein
MDRDVIAVLNLSKRGLARFVPILGRGRRKVARKPLPPISELGKKGWQVKQ